MIHENGMICELHKYAGKQYYFPKMMRKHFVGDEGYVTKEVLNIDELVEMAIWHLIKYMERYEANTIVRPDRLMDNVVSFWKNIEEKP